MFKLQSPSKYSPFDAIHLSRHKLAQNSFWTNSSIFMSFSASAIFVSPLPHWQSISLWELFSLGETKKVARGEVRWIGRVEHRGHFGFGQKLLNTQHDVSRYTYKSPIMKWANMLTESSKKLNETKKSSLSQHHQLGHWYRRVPRTLTQQGKPVLKGARPPEDNSIFLRGAPCISTRLKRRLQNSLKVSVQL